MVAYDLRVMRKAVNIITRSPKSQEVEQIPSVFACKLFVADDIF